MLRRTLSWICLLAPFVVCAAPVEDIDARIARMDTSELLGQTLLLGYNANDRAGRVSRSNEGLKRLVRKYHPGGVVLFKRNFDLSGDELQTRRDVHRLIMDTQYEALFNGHSPGVPLFIAVDHEGGSLLQLKKGITRFPSSMHIATTRDANLAFRVGGIMGRDLYALGFNMLLGPVADINNNDAEDVIGKRAYGSHKELVAQMATAVMLGIQSSGVLAVVKHYPGHGDSRGDPHFTLPAIQYRDPSRLEQWDLYPFEQAIRNGAEAIMTSHLLVPALDARLPVSLSERAVERKLRREIGFDGLVVSDDIGDMLAVTMDAEKRRVRDRFDATRMALESGTDMVMLAHVYGAEDARHPERTMTEVEFDRYYRRLVEYFDASEARREILRAHVRRILHAKERYIPPAYWQAASEADFPALPPWEKRKADRDFAREVAEQSLVLISVQGKPVFRMEEQSLFRASTGVIDAMDHVVLASPVFRDDELGEAITSALKDRGLPAPSIVHLIYGYKSKESLRRASRLWGEKVERLYHTRADGTRRYNERAIRDKAKEIVRALQQRGREAKAMLIFGMVTVAQGKVLEAVLQTPDLETYVSDVLVLLYKEPYHLASTVYASPLVSVLSLPAFPDLRMAAEALTGAVLPHSLDYLPFNVPGIVDRSRALGQPIVPLKLTEDVIDKHDTESGKPPKKETTDPLPPPPRPPWESILAFGIILALAMGVGYFMRRMDIGKPLVVLVFVLVLVMGVGIMGYFTAGEVLGLIQPLLSALAGVSP